ncbi:unnamed protein product [Adineta steineri]|uniref:Retrotransposon gag domain-containing protein n=1 Tax=Adineta steineri TaxID=433720 RepID=A0A818JWY8_9BILA|nr:unnamed protein product [Adineta steineri]
MATNQTSDQVSKFDLTLFDTFLAVEDVQPFKTLISICKPNKPTECTYLDLITKLRTNYAKVTFPSTKRIKFFALRQESAQTLTDYANVLRNKATTCQFPAVFYEQALITAFGRGLLNSSV